MTDTSNARQNPYASQYRSFVEQTKTHELVVLHDTGTYRHLRMAKPGTRMWSWDVTTWPYHLATSGDIAAGLVFSREQAMLDFFRSAGRGGRYSDGAPMIDLRYWAEKLVGGFTTVTKYDPETFLRTVREDLWAHDAFTNDPETQLAIISEAKTVSDEEHSAREWFAEHRWNGKDYTFGTDTWECDFRHYDTHFRFACWAIALTTDAWFTRESEAQS